MPPSSQFDLPSAKIEFTTRTDTKVAAVSNMPNSRVRGTPRAQAKRIMAVLATPGSANLFVVKQMSANQELIGKKHLRLLLAHLSHLRLFK